MSQLSRLVDDLSRNEQDTERDAGPNGEVLVPWQAYEADGRRLTIHYYTNAFNEFVEVQSDERDDEIRVTVLERHVSNKMPGQRRSQVHTLTAPVGGRHVVDGATGRVRPEFTPNPDAGWAAFDVAAAEWSLRGDQLSDLATAARAALDDGCRSAALERIAAGENDLSLVYRERGLEPPTRRAATKIVVDALLAEAAGREAYAQSIAFTLQEVAASRHIDADHRKQIKRLVDLARDIDKALAATGNANVAADRLLAACREMHADGGLRP